MKAQTTTLDKYVYVGNFSEKDHRKTNYMTIVLGQEGDTRINIPQKIVEKAVGVYDGNKYIQITIKELCIGIETTIYRKQTKPHKQSYRYRVNLKPKTLVRITEIKPLTVLDFIEQIGTINLNCTEIAFIDLRLMINRHQLNIVPELRQAGAPPEAILYIRLNQHDAITIKHNKEIRYLVHQTKMNKSRALQGIEYQGDTISIKWRPFTNSREIYTHVIRPNKEHQIDSKLQQERITTKRYDLDEDEYWKYINGSTLDKGDIAVKRAKETLLRTFNTKIEILKVTERKNNTLCGNIADIHAKINGEVIPIEVKSRVKRDSKPNTLKYISMLTKEGKRSLINHFKRPLYQDSKQGLMIGVVYHKPLGKCIVTIDLYWRDTNTPSLFFICIYIPIFHYTGEANNGYQ